MILGSIPGHTVEANTSVLDTGVLYSTASCSCERRGPFGGSFGAQEEWAAEHLQIVQTYREEVAARARTR